MNKYCRCNSCGTYLELPKDILKQNYMFCCSVCQVSLSARPPQFIDSLPDAPIHPVIQIPKLTPKQPSKPLLTVEQRLDNIEKQTIELENAVKGLVQLVLGS